MIPNLLSYFTDNIFKPGSQPLITGYSYVPSCNRSVFTGFGLSMGKIISVLALAAVSSVHSQYLPIIRQPQNVVACPWEDAEITVEVDNLKLSSAHIFIWGVNASFTSDPVPAFRWNKNIKWRHSTKTGVSDHLSSPAPRDTDGVTTFSLLIPNQNHQDFYSSVFWMVIVDLENVKISYNTDKATLTYSNTLTDSLIENQLLPSNQTADISWQPLPFLNSNIRYNLKIEDLTTGIPVDCEDCHFLAEPGYRFTPDSASGNHSFTYSVSFEYCPGEKGDEGIKLFSFLQDLNQCLRGEDDKAVQLLFPIDLKAQPFEKSILFEWASVYSQFDGPQLDDLYFYIQLSDKGDSTYSLQDKAYGYNYTFTPEQDKVCSTFIFAVNAAVSPFINITGKTITASLTNLGEPDVLVSQQNNQRVQILLDSPASLHRVTLTNSSGLVADVITAEKNLSFPVTPQQQALLVSVSPENCPGMSPVSTLFLTEDLSAETTVEPCNTAPGIYQPGMMITTIVGCILLFRVFLKINIRVM